MDEKDFVELLKDRYTTDIVFRDDLLEWCRKGCDHIGAPWLEGWSEWFNIPDAEEALQFGFETQPRHLHALNQQRLPFGCHAWWRYNLEFWRPFIREFGYDM